MSQKAVVQVEKKNKKKQISFQNNAKNQGHKGMQTEALCLPEKVHDAGEVSWHYHYQRHSGCKQQGRGGREAPHMGHGQDFWLQAEAQQRVVTSRSRRHAPIPSAAGGSSACSQTLS